MKIMRSLLLTGQIALLASAVIATAHSQVTQIDFRVIHLRGVPPAPEQYVAIRLQEAWAALWPENAKLPNAPPIPNIDFKHYILLIANTGIKPSSGYFNLLVSVDTLPASMTGVPSSRMPVTLVHIVEIGPGSCPRLTALMGTVAYALIPQTTNDIHFTVTKANSDCTGGAVNPPFIK